jgi:hypothetical protein
LDWGPKLKTGARFADIKSSTVADGTGVSKFPVAEMRPRGDRALLIDAPLVLLAPRRNMGTIALRPFVFRIRTW